jgi:hypothetical protein
MHRIDERAGVAVAEIPQVAGSIYRQIGK